MAPQVFNEMDLPQEHSVRVDGCDIYTTQSIVNKGKTTEHCVLVQHYL